MWNEVNNLEMVLVWLGFDVYFGNLLPSKMSDSYSGDWPNPMHKYFD